jgi:hypothetical protein
MESQWARTYWQFPANSEAATSESWGRFHKCCKYHMKFGLVSKLQFHDHPNSRIGQDQILIPNSLPEFPHPNRPLLNFQRFEANLNLASFSCLEKHAHKTREWDVSVLQQMEVVAHIQKLVDECVMLELRV